MAEVKKIRLIGGKVDPEYPWARILKKHIVDGHTWRARELGGVGGYDNIFHHATWAEALKRANSMSLSLAEEYEDATWD